MKLTTLRLSSLCLSIVFVMLFLASPAMAVDGKKWDGKAYPFKALNPSQPNSESNPFIIDTAGKLAYLSLLSRNQDLPTFGVKNGLKGLNWLFKNNYVKLTADLDMNGALYEFIAIENTWLNFDGDGHVITNLRISDKKTEIFFDDMDATAEIKLALFKGAENIKNLRVGKGSTITFNRDFYPYKKGKILLTVYAAAIAVEPNIMEGCSSDATISVKGTCNAYIGGLVAVCKYKLINSHFDGAIIVDGNFVDATRYNKLSVIEPGDLQVGGVCVNAGDNYDPSLKHGGIFGCYNTGSVTVKAIGNQVQMGGVTAYIGYRCECTDMYNTGKLSLSSDGDLKSAYVGGVVGVGNITYAIPFTKPIQYPNSGKIYNTGNIVVAIKTGKKICVGGVGGGEDKPNTAFNNNSYPFGGNYGIVSTYNTGSITVSTTDKVNALNVGGIVGWGRMVFNSYNTGNINGTSLAGTTINAGGIGGGSVYAQNCYSIGAINVKGTGTNVVGGIVGLADVLWGEDENHKSGVMNVFWLKQQQSGGINNNITYGKGSYSYGMKKGKMVEDYHLGAVYTFDSPTATILVRSDDGPGKRSGYVGSLLQALNELVAQRNDRNFRKWKVDGTNGGYPVFE